MLTYYSVHLNLPPSLHEGEQAFWLDAEGFNLN